MEPILETLVELKGWQGTVINFIVPCIPLFEFILKPLFKYFLLPWWEKRQQLKRIETNIKLLNVISLEYLCKLFNSPSQSMSLLKSDHVYKELKNAEIISDVAYKKDNHVTFYLNPLPKNWIAKHSKFLKRTQLFKEFSNSDKDYYFKLCKRYKKI